MSDTIERILYLIEQTNISAFKLTTDLELSNSAISDWKKRKAKPSTEAIVKIAEYFNVSTDYLLTGEEKNGKMTIGDVKSNNGVAGVNAPATITLNNGEHVTRELSKAEIELLKIYHDLDVKGRHKVLDLVFKLEEEKK